MPTINMVQNDTAPNLVMTVKRGSTAVDVTGAAVAFKIQRPDTLVLTNTGHNTCTLTTPTSGIVTYTFQTSDLPVAGAYTCDLEITYGSGKIETGFEPIIINVRAEV